MLLALLAVVTVPFLLFGEAIDGLTQSAMTGTTSRTVATAAGFSLLAADVVLPVPSTLVITVLGALLGSAAATLVAAAGLSFGCVLGYWLGRRLGHDFTRRAMGAEDFSYLARQLERRGVVVLALCRPVPVLAKASVIAAGATGMPAGKVLAVTTLANLGFAAVYACLGAAAASASGFILALAASISLPLAAILIAQTLRRPL
jgi:membrane protein DedA with SNARE-associated domain